MLEQKSKAQLAAVKLQAGLDKAGGSESFEEPVINHLIGRCREDEGFAEDVLNEKKSWEKCAAYLQDKARETAKSKPWASKSRGIFISDSQVYEWAEDYYRMEETENDAGRKKPPEKAKKAGNAGTQKPEENKGDPVQAPEPPRIQKTGENGEAEDDSSGNDSAAGDTDSTGESVITSAENATDSTKSTTELDEHINYLTNTEINSTETTINSAETIINSKEATDISTESKGDIKEPLYPDQESEENAHETAREPSADTSGESDPDPADSAGSEPMQMSLFDLM